MGPSVRVHGQPFLCSRSRAPHFFMHSTDELSCFFFFFLFLRPSSALSHKKRKVIGGDDTWSAQNKALLSAGIVVHGRRSPSGVHEKTRRSRARAQDPIDWPLSSSSVVGGEKGRKKRKEKKDGGAGGEWACIAIGPTWMGQQARTGGMRGGAGEMHRGRGSDLVRRRCNYSLCTSMWGGCTGIGDKGVIVLGRSGAVAPGSSELAWVWACALQVTT